MDVIAVPFPSIAEYIHTQLNMYIWLLKKKKILAYRDNKFISHQKVLSIQSILSAFPGSNSQPQIYISNNIREERLQSTFQIHK